MNNRGCIDVIILLGASLLLVIGGINYNAFLKEKSKICENLKAPDVEYYHKLGCE